MKKAFLEEELYKKVSINDLILFGILSIADSNKKCSFEILVHKCFTLFPRVFFLSKYPKWPDTRKLDRPLRALRNGKMITGNPKTFFILTKKGRKRALEVANVFRQKKLL
ncbi:MAG: hypothetical protein ACKKMV_02530 [Candidatus Nealsonbacteria bacterium]